MEGHLGRAVLALCIGAVTGMAVRAAKVGERSAPFTGRHPTQPSCCRAVYASVLGQRLLLSAGESLDATDFENIFVVSIAFAGQGVDGLPVRRSFGECPRLRTHHFRGARSTGTHPYSSNTTAVMTVAAKWLQGGVERTTVGAARTAV